MVGVFLKTEDASRINDEVESVCVQTGMRYPEHKLTDIVKRYMGGSVDILLHNFSGANKEISGAISFASKDGSSKTTIFINENKHPVRQLFTLAHEFGHFVLGHSKRGENNKFRIDFGSDYYPSNPQVRLEELEANHFAGAILMSEKKINELKEAGYSTGAMADYFSVSKSALHFRLAWLDRANQEAGPEYDWQ